jgi:hypothetical protein
MALNLRGRRSVLAALLVCAIGCGLPAHAQDPRYSEAQAAALAWLALADADDAPGSYNAAAKRFQSAMSVEQWAVVSKQAREKFGATKRRTIIGTQPPRPGPDVPPGEFVVIVYRTEFDKHPSGNETLTLEREPDGKWRVVGYLMR